MCKLLFFLPLQRKQQADYFCIVFFARRNLVALQEEIVDKVLCLTYQRRIALLPIAVLGVELLFHLRADGLQPCLVIFFRQQMGGIGDDVGQQSKVPAILQSRNVRFCTSPISPIIRLGLVANPQQMGKFVGISKGIAGQTVTSTNVSQNGNFFTITLEDDQKSYELTGLISVSGKAWLDDGSVFAKQ